jgi:hypothetical protein
MSNEPVLKAIPDDAPAADAQSGDARLRSEIAEVLATIAQAKAALDDARRRHDEADSLLRDAESRAQLMLGLIASAADAEPPVADAEPPAPVDEAHLRSVEEQAFLDALGLYDAVEVAPDARQFSQEPERVPTVSDVVSQLGRGGTEPAALQADETNAVRMLEAMVEELAAAMPIEPRAERSEPAPLPAAEVESVTEPALTASVQESGQQPPEPIAEQQAADEPELENPEQEPQAIVAEEIAPPDEAPPEAAALPAEAMVEAELAEPEREAAEQEAIQERPEEQLEPPIEATVPAFEQPSDETAAISAPDESQPAPQEPVVAALEQDSTQDEQTAAREPLIPENELLTNFARMTTRPFLPPEIGTAVIFDSTHAPSAAAQSGLAGEAASLGEAETAEAPALGETTATTAAAPAPKAVSAPSVPPDITIETTTTVEPPVEPMISVATPEPVNDIDLDALLFGSPSGSEPPVDAEQAVSPPWPEPPGAAPASPETAMQPAETPQAAWAVDLPVPASARAATARAAETPSSALPVAAASPAPAATRDGDPLAPLRAMSDEEKIALFE